MVKMWEYAATEQLLILIVTLMVPPLLILVVLILLLATFGKSLGIRRAYVNLLLQIFEVSNLTNFYLLEIFGSSCTLNRIFFCDTAG